ncbi:hypothetical protein GGX14DRAFT_398488 [Mycena pura]|uniref:Uncharacterized protein n=1 Tax=Mycena pura TaxID=153505 RepID=A0AAD6Y7V6_9AGAR|nr:hypothetical protein GGX14DRAFT_398488 [Mycena pura]
MQSSLTDRVPTRDYIFSIVSSTNLAGRWLSELVRDVREERRCVMVVGMLSRAGRVTGRDMIAPDGERGAAFAEVSQSVGVWSESSDAECETAVGGEGPDGGGAVAASVQEGKGRHAQGTGPKAGRISGSVHTWSRGASPFPLSFTISMPSKRLPVQELCDAIVDLLLDNRYDLRSIARASRSFAPRAQSHLFRELKSVTITQRLVDTMKSSPHLIPMVEILSFDGAKSPALDLLASIPWQRVHRLHLGPIESRASGVNLEGVQTLISLPSVRHVQLEYECGTRYHRREVFGLLSHLNPGVEVLEFINLSLKYSPSHPYYNNEFPKTQDDPTPPPPHSRAVVPRLRQLGLIRSPGDFLCEPGCPLDLSALHELELHNASDVLLSTVSATVRKLTVDEVGDIKSINIHLLHNITDIYCQTFGKYSLLHRLFDHVASDNRISNIYITTNSNGIEHNSKPDKWDGFVVAAGDLDRAVLARLPVLQKVFIKVKRTSMFLDEKELQKKVEDAFPKLVEQNLLEVSFEDY